MARKRTLAEALLGDDANDPEAAMADNVKVAVDAILDDGTLSAAQKTEKIRAVLEHHEEMIASGVLTPPTADDEDDFDDPDGDDLLEDEDLDEDDFDDDDDDLDGEDDDALQEDDDEDDAAVEEAFRRVTGRRLSEVRTCTAACGCTRCFAGRLTREG